MMKNNVFNIIFVMSITMIACTLRASDQKNIGNNVDEKIFTINGCIASPYSTAFIKTLSDSYVEIEFDCIDS